VIAVARAVGLWVVDFFQGRLFAIGLVDEMDTASGSRAGVDEALTCWGKNSVLRAVGDSTMGVTIIVPFSPWRESRVVSGVVRRERLEAERFDLRSSVLGMFVLLQAKSEPENTGNVVRP